MLVGRVISFFATQGYGYIELADGREVYFHDSTIERNAARNSIQAGSWVHVDLLDTRYGLEAARVALHSTG